MSGQKRLRISRPVPGRRPTRLRSVGRDFWIAVTVTLLALAMMSAGIYCFCWGLQLWITYPGAGRLMVALVYVSGVSVIAVIPCAFLAWVSVPPAVLKRRTEAARG